jgi:putative SOS response-associated peptidase YedK
VPADGFYEWADAATGPRQPYWIARPDGACFAIAALFESWRGAGGEALETCTLITTDANERLRAVHGRMPVILEPADWPLWLDPALRDASRLRALLRPAPAEALALRPVSRRVNRTECDDAACIAPAAGAPA